MKAERFVICGDSHGDMIDAGAERAFRAFVKSFKPDIRIHLGDYMDLRPLRKGANDEEKREGMQQDVEQGIDFLRWYDPQIVMKGNHDQRLDDMFEYSGDKNRKWLAKMLIDSIADQLPNIRFYPYCKRKGIYQFGDYKLMHGYNANLHAAYKASSHYGNVIMGHVHTPTGPVRFPHYDGAVGYTCGCLCRLDMEYNRSHLGTLKQGHGWLYGWKAHNKLDIRAMTTAGSVWRIPKSFDEVKA